MITLRDDTASLFGAEMGKSPVVNTDHITVHTIRVDLEGPRAKKDSSEKSVDSPIQNDSPFGTPPSSDDSSISADASKKMHPSSPASIPAKKNTFSTRFLPGTLLVIFITIIVASGYYLFLIRNKDIAVPSEQAPSTEEKNLPAPEPIQEPRYSETLPNYFTVNTEEGQPADITRALSSAADAIMAQRSLSPVEFVVVDANNTPVSFHVFALLYNLSLPQDLLSALEEEFSLYIAPDGDTTRMGIAISLKDAAKTQTELKKAEPQLFTILSPLFLDTTIPAAPVSFNDSTYTQHAIRYANGDTTESFSVDYTLTATHLVIGTSKNSTRAILDKRDAMASVTIMENVSDRP